MADERVLRVFISSTFRDMQGEREELVKRVFPEIRRRCEERGVVWGEIDLRWGVTDEQKAEGAVLPICLAEIERTRPYFIGMLGERYGWVPDEISAELRDREAWLRDDAGRSVTELEVLHGVLNAPQMAGHALFYLRDPAWVETLPADERATYVEDGAEGRRRLVALKDRVRGSGFPVRDYADPRAIGALVRTDLLALLERVFPGERAPSPAEAARLDQRAHAEALLPATLDRRDDLLAIAVAADAEGPGAVVTGSPGSGVSTALAAFARARRAERPGDLVVEHHVAAQRGEASEAALLDHLAGELALALDEPPPDDGRTGFAPLLARAAAARRVLLVVDGLHLIESAGGGVAWLPLTLPAGVDVVAGTRPGATAVWLQGRGLSRIDLQLFTAEQREAATVAFLAASSKALDRSLLDRIRTADRLASPRQLRVVLDELRQHGDHFTLGPLLDSLLAPQDLDGLLDVVLDRLERDYELDRPGLVGETLGALAASRTGLSEAELLDLLGDGARQPLSQLQLGAGGLLPEIGGYMRLGNDALARAAARRYLPDAAPMHLRLAALFAGERTSARALDELPWQLLGGRDYDGLARLLADTLFIEAAHARDPSLLLRLWTKLEAESPHRAATAYAGFVRDPASRATSIVTPIVAARGGVRETLALRSAAVEALRRDDPKAQLPAGLANLAAAHMAAGQLAEARGALDELERLVGDGGEPELRIALFQNRGAVLRALGERERALADLERAERLARESARPLDVQSAAGERAGILAELGRRDEALAASAAQIEAATVSGDASSRMRALVTRGALLMDGGDIAGAAQATGEAEYIARDLGDLEWLAAALTLHVRLREWENRLDLARPAMEELIEVSERLGRTEQAAGMRALLAAVPAAPLQDDLAQLRDRINEAQAMMARGDFNGALAAHGEIEPIAGRLGNQGAIAAAVGDQAVCLYYLGRLPEALPLMLRQIELQRPLGDDIALAKALANTGELQGRLGQPAQGLALIEEAEGLARRAGQAEFAGQIAQLAEQIRRRGS